jgi:hypothetical protein
LLLKRAVEIGDEAGLETVAESVNNVIIHAGNLFAYTDIEKEIKELVDDAKVHGIEFHKECGMAMINPRYCYTCEKLKLKS